MPGKCLLCLLVQDEVNLGGQLPAEANQLKGEGM